MMNEQNVLATARYLYSESIEHVVSQWRLSTEESKALKLLIDYRESGFNADVEHLVGCIAIDFMSHEEATLILKFDGDEKKLTEWSNLVLPVFPINGKDLITLGFKPGKRLGDELKYLKSQWKKFNYILTKDELLEIAKTSVGEES